MVTYGEVRVLHMVTWGRLECAVIYGEVRVLCVVRAKWLVGCGRGGV